jgi:hypothetical protein
MRVDEGHFGDVPLDGLHWLSLVAWPGAIHEGNGACLAVVDERADERQRAALLTILSGDETVPGATIFNVFATTFTTVHPPQFRPIEFSADIPARIGHFSVPGLIEASAEPILNPVTKQPHRVREGGRSARARLGERPCPLLHDAYDAAGAGRLARPDR